MPYQPIQMPQPEGIGGLAEFIMAARQRAQQENAQRAEMTLRQQQFDAGQTEKYRQSQMDAQQMGLQQSRLDMQDREKRLVATQQLTAALDAGRPDLAKQIAATYGIPFQPNAQQKPGDTLMRPSPEVPQAPEYGPQATPEIAREAGNIRAELASFEPGDTAQGDQFYRDQAENERTRFETAQRPFEMIGQMPMQPREATYQVNNETYDPQQRREAEAATRDRNTERFAGAFRNVEELQKYIPVYQAGVTAGKTPEQAFDKMMDMVKSDAEANARAEDKRLGREQSDINNRRMTAAIGARPQADRPFKEAARDRAEESSIDQMTSKVFANTGFKEVQVANRKFNDMASQLSKPNAAMDAVSSGSFVKMAQGGTGVISDSDMDAFWNRIGGVKERTGQWVENVLSGKIVPEKRAIVTKAVQDLAARAGSNLSEIRDSLRFRLNNSGFADRADDQIGTYFPSERAKIEEGRRIDRAKNRTRAAREKGGGRDALDAELDGL